MARIANLETINKEKVALLNIARTADESVLVTADETKEVIRNYIKEELQFFANESARGRKTQLAKFLNDRLNEVETSLNDLINKKFDKLAERMVRETKESVIESEVNRRVELKLQKIREAL